MTKEETFRAALVDAYHYVLQIENEHSYALPRSAIVAARALYAWSKIDVTNMDIVARALVLLPDTGSRIVNGFKYTNVPVDAFSTVKDLNHRIDVAIVSAIESLSAIVDNVAMRDDVARLEST